MIEINTKWFWLDITFLRIDVDMKNKDFRYFYFNLFMVDFGTRENHDFCESLFHIRWHKGWCLDLFFMNLVDTTRSNDVR